MIEHTMLYSHQKLSKKEYRFTNASALTPTIGHPFMIYLEKLEKDLYIISSHTYNIFLLE